MTSGLAVRIASVALAAVGLGAVAGCGSKNEFVPPPPPAVSVATPVTQEVADKLEFTGTTSATATVDLRARVTGYLREIKFEDGALVNEGDLLFVIEQSPFKTALDLANANVEKAQASLSLAQIESERTAELLRRKAASQQEVDLEAAQLATAKADLAAAQASLKKALLDMQYTEIRAPLTGRIGRHLVDVGNLVQSEQTLLGKIESIHPIHAYFHLSESDLLRFNEVFGSMGAPSESAPVLEMRLADEADYVHEGHLDFRELGVDPETGTIMRRGLFENPDSKLVPGLFVRIRAQVGDPQPKLLVEERALGADQRGDYVLTVNDKNVVEYKPVVLGIAVGDKRVVERGIAANDRVIVNGLQRARPGAPVTIDEPKAEQAVASAAAGATK